jgi:hypothetical protein
VTDLPLLGTGKTDYVTLKQMAEAVWKKPSYQLYYWSQFH